MTASSSCHSRASTWERRPKVVYHPVSSRQTNLADVVIVDMLLVAEPSSRVVQFPDAPTEFKEARTHQPRPWASLPLTIPLHAL